MGVVSARKGLLGMGGAILLKILLCFLVCEILVVSTIMFFQFGWLLWILEALVFLLLIVFLYQPMYERGDKDRGYYARNSLKPDQAFGFKSGLIAAIPLYLMTGWIWLVSLGLIPDFNLWDAVNSLMAYRLLNPFIWPLIGIVSPTIYVIDLSWYHFLIFLAADSIVPVTCGIAYFLGLKGILVSDKIMYERKTARKK